MHSQQDSFAAEPMRKEDLPFFRDAVSLIDACSKLTKDDRILLRNRVKEYARDLRDSGHMSNQKSKELIEILIATDKRKPLVKCSQDEGAMQRLQMQLRKYIQNQKKQQDKKQANHRFIKIAQPPNGSGEIAERIKTIFPESPVSVFASRKLSVMSQSPHKLAKSNHVSLAPPNPRCQVRKIKVTRFDTQQSLERSHNKTINREFHSMEKLSSPRFGPPFPSNKQNKQNRVPIRATSKHILLGHLKSHPISKKDYCPVRTSGFCLEESKCAKFQESARQLKKMLENPISIYHQGSLSNQGSRPISIRQPPSANKSPSGNNFPKRSEPSHFDESLFTPPELLAECRRFITGQKSFTEQPTALTPMILEYSPSPQHVPLKQTNVEPLSQSFSSAFQKNIKIDTAQQVIRKLFADNYEKIMTPGEIKQFQLSLSARMELAFQKYIYFLGSTKPKEMCSQHIVLNFITTCKYMEAHVDPQLVADNSFCKLVCEVLDIERKGYVRHADVRLFVENLRSACVNEQVGNSIQFLLNRVFAKALQVEQSETTYKSNEKETAELVISEWSLFYLEIKNCQEFYRLCDALDQFEFHFQSRTA